MYNGLDIVTRSVSFEVALFGAYRDEWTTFAYENTMCSDD